MRELILSILFILCLSFQVSALGPMSLMSGMGTSGTDYTADANCMGAWFMNGASGGDGSEDEIDRSGEGQTLSVSASDTIPDGASVPSGYSGVSRDLEYDDLDYLGRAESDTNGFDISGADQDMTLCAWFNLEAVSAGSGTIVNKVGSSNVQYDLYWDANEKAKFFISADGTGVTTSGVSTTTLSAGTWYHLCGVYDDDEGSSNNVQIWVNGTMENASAHTTGIFNGNADFRIGVRADTATRTDGQVDEVIIFNRALSSVEINEIMDHGIDGAKGGND